MNRKAQSAKPKRLGRAGAEARLAALKLLVTLLHGPNCRARDTMVAFAYH